MRLTSFTDYSLCVLMYVAQKEGDLASIREVSEAYGISKNHLMKVVHLLGKGDYLDTVRGKNGGFRLSKDPAKINIGALIRYTEDDLNIVSCFGDKGGHCALNDECGFASVMEEALQAFLSTVDKYTLNDLIAGNKAIKF